MVYWDADSKKDLLVGQADGHIRLYTNVHTDVDPRFDGGVLLQVGPPGGKTDINVGGRTTLSITDWNNDGRRDLIVGMHSGYVHLYQNEGTDTAPEYRTTHVVQDSGVDLRAPSTRSAPTVVDLDLDGRKDLLVGNTDGQLLLYRNVGTDSAPVFSGYDFVHSSGAPIDLDWGPRSRPNLCDWTGDGRIDVLLGSADGKVRLYQGLELITAVCFGDGSAAPCPCGNNGTPGAGEGCVNSTGVGGRLASAGSTSVFADDLVLHGSRLAPNNICFYLQGPALAPAPFADGVLCFGVPQVTRLQEAGIDGNGEVVSVGSIAAAGGALAGQILYYQLWYRDGGGPCGSTANLSNALRVPWSP